MDDVRYTNHTSPAVRRARMRAELESAMARKWLTAAACGFVLASSAGCTRPPPNAPFPRELANCAALDEMLDPDVETKNLRAVPPPFWLLVSGTKVRCQAEFCASQICRSECRITPGEGGVWRDVRAVLRGRFGPPTRRWSWDWRPERAEPGEVYGTITVSRMPWGIWIHFEASDGYSDWRRARCKCEEEDLPLPADQEAVFRSQSM